MGEQANDPTYIGFSCIAEQYQRKVRIANKLISELIWTKARCVHWTLARAKKQIGLHRAAIYLPPVKASRKLSTAAPHYLPTLLSTLIKSF